MTREQAVATLAKYVPQRDLSPALAALLKDAQDKAAVNNDLANLARAAVVEFKDGFRPAGERPAWDALVEAVRQSP